MPATPTRASRKRRGAEIGVRTAKGGTCRAKSVGALALQRRFLVAAVEQAVARDDRLGERVALAVVGRIQELRQLRGGLGHGHGAPGWSLDASLPEERHRLVDVCEELRLFEQALVVIAGNSGGLGEYAKDCGMRRGLLKIGHRVEPGV